MKQGKYVSEFEIVLNELNIHLQLNHENIIKIYSVLNDDNKDKIYFVLEYCSQGTLLNWDDDL
jgi:serine/threonine protein kinase